MPEVMPAGSVGLVKPRVIEFDQPLMLNCGAQLDTFELVIETYGELNPARSNAVLICHALSGHHHAAGYHHKADQKPGWWDNFIGPGKPIDTNRFYVVALNNLGGCHGSSGPTTLNPKTGKLYGPDFPVVTVADWVNSQLMLMNALGIEQWAAVIGGSLGGMQALQWSIAYPNKLRHAVIIASAARLSAQNIAFNEVARQAIMTDEQFFDGHYLENNSIPRNGLGLARMVGHITYLSDDAMGSKFGRELKNDCLSYDYNVEFQIESYLRYQGETFSGQFDANTYLLMTRALDYFDPASEHGHCLATALQHVTAKFFLASFSTDWRFAPERSREIVDALMSVDKDVTYLEVDAPQGHDAFLMDIPRYARGLAAYLNRVAEECV